MRGTPNEAGGAVLRHSLRRSGPDSLIREQIVGALRRNLGSEHENTLRAEAHLGRCLLDLDRAEDAEPILVHIVADSEHSPGKMSPDTLDSMLCLAVVHQKSGRPDEARQLLERALLEYALHGLAEGTAAMDVSTLLAAILFLLNEVEEATLLCRHILDVRGRTLGPDDPETLRSLQSLIRVLIGAGHLAEARVMAASLLEKRILALGEAHEDTLKAQELLDSTEQS
jgi:hypothetical protein